MFQFRSGDVYSIQHYVIKFVSYLRQVGGFLQQQNWQPRYNWNIVESGVKHHKPNLINVRVTLCCTDSKRETTATQVDFLIEIISSNNSIEFVCFLSSERNDVYPKLLYAFKFCQWLTTGRWLPIGYSSFLIPLRLVGTRYNWNVAKGGVKHL